MSTRSRRSASVGSVLLYLAAVVLLALLLLHAGAVVVAGIHQAARP